MEEELKFKAECRNEINYYRNINININDLISEKTELYYKTSEDLTNIKRKKFIKEQIKKEMQLYKNYNSIREDKIDEYINLMYKNEILIKKILEYTQKLTPIYKDKRIIENINSIGFYDANELIENFEFMNEYNYSLKEYLEELLKMSSISTVCATIPSSLFITTLNIIDYGHVTTNMVIDAILISLVLLSVINGSFIIKRIPDWLYKMNTNKKASKLLKEIGLYDFLIEKIKLEEERELLLLEVENLTEKRKIKNINN